MGYDIKPISERNIFDYSLCIGFSTKDTVRRSLDGQLFIVEGDSFNTYTHAQILVEMEKPNWTETIE
jgi:hypothetical protein